MRVLTVGNMYPPYHQGGYEQDWAAGVDALHAAGHDVRVLVSDHREPSRQAADSVYVSRTLRWYWRDHAFPRMPLRERLALERHNAAVLAAQLEHFSPDIVSWWPMGGMSLALIEQVQGAGLPALGVVYDDWMVYGPQVDGWQRAWSRRPARLAAPAVAAVTGIATPARFARAARWYFASDSVRRAAVDAVPGLPDSELLPPGVDELFFDPQPEQAWSWRLLAPGRLDPRKGLTTAIEALALIPHARLEIVGGGNDDHARELTDLATRLHVADRVTFAPARPRSELVRAYAEADAILFPVVWAEPFGLVPLEAMALGRPVVASGRGGSGEYLRDGQNCLLHTPGDPASLAAAITRLAESEDLRRRLVQGGLQTALQFRRSKWNQRVVAAHEAARTRR